MTQYKLIGDYLKYWAKTQGGTEALVWNDQRITYSDFHDQVSDCARALILAGITKGDRIAMLSPPRPEVMVVYLAASEVGAIFVGLNAKGRLDEFRYVLKDAQPKILISILSHRKRDYQNDILSLQSEFTDLKSVITLDRAIPDHTKSYLDFLNTGQSLSEASLAAIRQTVDPDDPAIIVYTSGSTGEPKGALVTHRSVIAGMSAQAERFKFIKPMRLLFPIPIHHLGSIGNIGTSTLISGGTTVFLDHFTPQAGLELIQKEKITLWAQVPTMLLMQLSLPEFDTYDLSSVQAIFFSGSAISREAVERLSQLGAELITGYGLTETSGPATLTGPGATLEDLSKTIGVAVPNAEVKIVNENGNTIKADESGEILVRGDCIFKGYYNRPEATKEAIDEQGWFHTGDLAIYDDRGKIRIVGRKQEVFKSGGANVYPREVEKILEEHPDVTLACVVSIPDPVYQEVGHAYILPRSGAAIDEKIMHDYCRERLAKYKIPKHFTIRESLPTIGIGKVDRAKLKKEARQ
jgi:acyl-CoA synthetase (AMP-forming)/AMP-acid ligase II